MTIRTAHTYCINTELRTSNLPYNINDEIIDALIVCLYYIPSNYKDHELLVLKYGYQLRFDDYNDSGYAFLGRIFDLPIEGTMLHYYKELHNLFASNTDAIMRKQVD